MKRIVEKFYVLEIDKNRSEFLSRLDRNFQRLATREKIVSTIPATGNYTIVETDELVVYTGAGPDTYYLPNATLFDGYCFTIKNAGTGNLTIDATNNGGIFAAVLANTYTLVVGDGRDFIAANGSWQLI